MELEENRAALEKSGRRLVGISYDPVPILASFSERRKIGFPLLSDEGSGLIRSLGLQNERVPKTTFRYGVPHPGTFVLDKAGRVMAKSFEEDPRERETLGSILTSTLNTGSGMVKAIHRTKHLAVTTSASNAVIRPNQVVRLRLDVSLKPGMHVYAPGVVGYKAISWEMDPSPAFRARRRFFPPPQQRHLRAIGETVPVYERDFSVQMEVVSVTQAAMNKVLEPNAPLRMAGTFTYQACDEKTCHLPVTIPVSWTLRYDGVIEPRAPEAIQHKPAAQKD